MLAGRGVMPGLLVVTHGPQLAGAGPPGVFEMSSPVRSAGKSRGVLATQPNGKPRFHDVFGVPAFTDSVAQRQPSQRSDDVWTRGRAATL